MFCTITKQNKTHVAKVYAMVEAPAYPNEGSNWGTDPTYAIIEIKYSRGKVTSVEEYGRCNVTPWVANTTVPEFIMDHPQVKELLEKYDNELKAVH